MHSVELIPFPVHPPSVEKPGVEICFFYLSFVGTLMFYPSKQRQTAAQVIQRIALYC